ncbi:MAG: hypothetical protein R3279_13595, partial [Putridiphycobacter sp.]|nr:hypothetical protein [Putridiphycobacter sp.]
VNKAGLKQYIQPIFTREFKVIGKGQTVVDVMEILKTSFKYLNLRLDVKDSLNNPKVRTHQFINLGTDYRANYSTNAKRLIKRANIHFQYRRLNNLDVFIDLIKDTLMTKIDEFNTANIEKLSTLMQVAQAEKKGKAIGIFDLEGHFVGAGFFFQHQNTVTYLKGTAIESAKKNGAMYGLIDSALQLFENEFEIFDFGGSDIDNVANFYHKFGALDRTYYHYIINNLPLWYRILKNVWKR